MTNREVITQIRSALVDVGMDEVEDAYVSEVITRLCYTLWEQSDRDCRVLICYRKDGDICWCGSSKRCAATHEVLAMIRATDYQQWKADWPQGTSEQYFANWCQRLAKAVLAKNRQITNHLGMKEFIINYQRTTVLGDTIPREEHV